VEARPGEVSVAELVLNDEHGHTLPRHLDGVSVAQLVWREAAPHTGSGRGCA
jgi:hypothetical protein